MLRPGTRSWRDRIDPSFAWTIEQDYLRDRGRTRELASHLVAAKAEYIADSWRFGSGLLMPVAGLRGFGRLLEGARTAREEARDVSETAARIGRLPSRQWNVALLEAHAALFSGERKRAIEQANRAMELMTVERDALLGPMVMGAAATVLEWPGQGDEAVRILRRVTGNGLLYRWITDNEDDRGQPWTMADDVQKTENRKNVVVRGGIEPPT